jgi:hypothetical protein
MKVVHREKKLKKKEKVKNLQSLLHPPPPPQLLLMKVNILLIRGKNVLRSLLVLMICLC